MSSEPVHWVCEVCEREGKRFELPSGDSMSSDLISYHLKEEHGIRPPNTVRRTL